MSVPARLRGRPSLSVPPVIDLHCHLLPGLDDGARTTEQAISALCLLAEHGVTEVVCTPHLRAGDIVAFGGRAIERRDAALAALRSVAPSQPVLHPGFEILLDEPARPSWLCDGRYALCGSRHYLVEFRLSVVAGLATRILEDIVRAGATPVVAHVERYGACSPGVIVDWRSVGAKIQVDATALTRPTSRGRLARSLVAEGLVDVLAADNHGDTRSLRTAVKFLRTGTADGTEAVERAVSALTRENPKAVVSGASMAVVPPIRFDEGWMERLRRLLGR